MKNIVSNIVENLQDRLFRSVVSNNLIYNTCWEDSRIDRELLQLDSNSKVVMLTSAGCNALHYLLDNPQEIHCIDANPAQNALLEFKMALVKNQNYHLLWDFFGEGKKRGAELIYQRRLRSHLSAQAQQYWDQNISNFTPTSTRPSFYFSGTSGKVALIMHNRIRRKGLYPLAQKLLDAKSLEEQSYFFKEIEPELWNTFSKWLVRRHATMTMLGVPAAQQRMIKAEYQGGLLHFIRQSLRQVFTKLPLKDNYFWRVYLTGKYIRDCCPNYLLEQHFEKLTRNINRLNSHTTTLSQYLRRKPGTFSHFVLLDHQDWIADKKPLMLAEEWKQILLNSKSGSRILFRSAGSSLDFLPDFVFNEVEFQPELTKVIHKKDRVGTYESTHLGIVR